MTKRIFSVLLAVMLAIGIAVPAFADDDDQKPEPTGISISPSSLYMPVGYSDVIYATVSPSDADDTVKWRSADEKIAQVSDGYVTGVAVGTTYITASTINGKTATCRVTVRADGSADVTPTGVRITPNAILIAVGGSGTVAATVSPAGADTTVTWRSENEKVATIGDDGYVTGVSAGTTSITATTSNGKIASCRVTVRGDSVPATRLEMSLTKMNVRMDQTRQLWVQFTPSDSTEKNGLDWSSSNNDVATVDSNGVVTGVGPGTAIITAKGSRASTSCEVTVSGSVVTGLTKDVTTSASDAATSGAKLGSSEAAAVVKEAAASTQKGKVGTASYTGKTSVSQAAISASAFAAKEANRTVLMRFVTPDEKGNTKASFVFDPAAVTGRETDLKTGISLDSQKVKLTQSRFGNNYRNDVVVLELKETGDLGFTAQIAAKVDLDGMLLTNLYFYAYDYDKNSYELIDAGNARVDSNKYLRFSTNKGGLIIVSDGQLKAKS